MPRVKVYKRVSGWRVDRLWDTTDPHEMVYGLSDGQGNIKIGKSVWHPILRLRTLATGNPNELKIIGYSAHTTEKHLHRQLRQYRVRREWFRCTREVLLAIEEFDYLDVKLWEELFAQIREQ